MHEALTVLSLRGRTRNIVNSGGLLEVLLAPEQNDSLCFFLPKVVRKLQSSGCGACLVRKIPEANGQISEDMYAVLAQRRRNPVVRQQRLHCTAIWRTELRLTGGRVALDKHSMESLKSGRQVLDSLQGNQRNLKLVQKAAHEDWSVCHGRQIPGVFWCHTSAGSAEMQRHHHLLLPEATQERRRSHRISSQAAQRAGVPPSCHDRRMKGG